MNLHLSLHQRAGLPFRWDQYRAIGPVLSTPILNYFGGKSDGFSIGNVSGPIILWENYGYEGWQPKSYQTMKEALSAQRYQSEFVVTMLVDFDVVSVHPANSSNVGEPSR
jgi:hypothetical protein